MLPFRGEVGKVGKGYPEFRVKCYLSLKAVQYFDFYKENLIKNLKSVFVDYNKINVAKEKQN